MVDLDVATRNLRNATLKVQDSGASNSLTIAIDEGNLNFVITRANAVVMNRGVISHRAQTSDVPGTFSFTAKYVALDGRSATGADPTLYEACTGTGNASAWVSTEDCGPYAIDLVWTLTSPCLASASDEGETVTFPSAYIETFTIDEGEEYNTIAVAGNFLATAPTAARA